MSRRMFHGSSLATMLAMASLVTAQATKKVPPPQTDATPTLSDPVFESRQVGRAAKRAAAKVKARSLKRQAANKQRRERSERKRAEMLGDDQAR